ncbi:MAG: LuxR C-terminal-related transcriptional regulator [Nocardioides sp.]
MNVVEELVRAREAYDRREWVAAYDGLSDSGELAAEDFMRLATAAYLLGRRNDCVQAMQRAYQEHVDAGEVGAAVRCACSLAMVLLDGGEAAVAGGWTARARRLLDGVAADVVERGYLLVPQMYLHVFAGEFDDALSLAGRVEDYGRRYRDPDLLAQGGLVRGRMLLFSGEVPQGLALLDEAMVSVAAGEVSPIVAGHLYCAMIEGCQTVADLARAAEWTTNLTNWCRGQPDLVPFTGQCSVHRGQIMRIHAAFAEALEEFDRAVARYAAAGSAPAAGLAWAERGEVLRVCGEYDAAEDAFAQALAYGHDPQPLLARLWLDRGRTDAAAAAIRRILAEPADAVTRVQHLPVATEVLLADGAAEEAAAAARELGEAADRFGVPALLARAAHAEGAVALACGEAARAVPLLRRAARQWARLDAPYESARSRVLVGRALRELGDEDSAVGEISAACHVFDTVGARPDARTARSLLHPSLPSGLTSREVEVLRLVASGRSNPEIAADLVLSEKTVARHLSNIFTKLDVRSRTAAAAYAFEHHLT